MKKFAEFINAFNIKVPLAVRITIGVGLLGMITLAIILPLVLKNEPTERLKQDENVYLYEEVVFADEIFVKCVGINAEESESGKMTLNLWVDIEQWNTDANINQQKITSDMFQLRLVDKDAPSPVSAFMGALARATLSAAVSVVVGGDVNVLEETVGFAGDYITSGIENAVSRKDNTIKSTAGQFEPFYPHEENGFLTIRKLSFELTDSFLNSTNTMVLSIDTARRVEKNIFLVLRPNTKQHTVALDFNGGSSETLETSIFVETGKVTNLPIEVPIREGYGFVCWTSEKDKIATKLRDFYFTTNQDSITFTAYAFWQPLIPKSDFINIGESISFKNDTIEFAIMGYDYSDKAMVKNKNQEIVEVAAASGKKFVCIDIVINKTKTGSNTKLDNDNDFYIVNKDVGKAVTSYFGYTKFKSFKPIDDYTWIGIDISEIGTYEFTMVFEISKNWLLDKKLLFLEVDFFATANALTILLQE